MNRFRRAVLLANLFAVAAHALPFDAGGGDITVALFSTRIVQSITVSPSGASAWTSTCARCKHTPLRQTIHVSGPVELFAGGTLQVRDDRSGEERRATGLWHIRGKTGDIDVVLTIPSEHYVAAVLAAEAAADEPPESLQALAIVARTYAVNGKHFSAQPGHLSAALCDSTQCQAIQFGAVSEKVADAVRATAGETLWYGARRAEVLYSENCGGMTEEAGALWPALAETHYLKSHPDPYCIRHGVLSWHTEIPLTDLAAVGTREGWKLPAQIVRARITQRSVSHRALRITLTGADGKSMELSASALRFGIGRALGWNRVQSDAYDLALRNGSLVFDGRGRGHAVGLCQAGAAEMAKEGAAARQILSFYFPGTRISIGPADSGWQEEHVGSISVRTIEPLNTAERHALEQSWQEAQKRFPSRRAAEPVVTFAPGTELFRQLTSQPGWMLATAQGDHIVLQPADVFVSPKSSLAKTLLHEMLHVLVEGEANERAPLWLREGLVEVLAGDSVGDPPADSISIANIEAELRNPSTRAANEKAHHEAEAKVTLLVQHYGISAVRGWLTTGVPSGAL